jgi:penicillin-binding protein 1A
MGFDTPKNMGEGETGGTLAAPVFRDFMTDALKGVDVATFRAPPNVRFVRVDGQTGYLPTAATTQTLLEAFKPGTEPSFDVDTSTFVYGGGEQIDPEALRSLGGMDGAAPNEGVVAQSQQAPPEVLGTADEGEGGLF